MCFVELANIQLWFNSTSHQVDLSLCCAEQAIGLCVCYSAPVYLVLCCPQGPRVRVRSNNAPCVDGLVLS